MNADILSRREVERILDVVIDEDDEARALARHDAALRTHCETLRSLLTRASNLILDRECKALLSEIEAALGGKAE